MDWKTFFAEIISTLAWPIVIIFVILQLKDKVGDLLPRIKKFKFKDTELEFIETIQELSEESKDTSPIKSKETVKSKTILYNLANISSRSAIIEAYRLLEVMTVKSIEIAYPELEQKNIRNQSQLIKMLGEKILNSEQHFQLIELRNLRNNAVHNEEFSLTGEPINTYIDLALSLMDILEKYNKTQEEEQV
jgi:hypothetical protein